MAIEGKLVKDIFVSVSKRYVHAAPVRYSEMVNMDVGKPITDISEKISSGKTIMIPIHISSVRTRKK